MYQIESEDSCDVTLEIGNEPPLHVENVVRGVRGMSEVILVENLYKNMTFVKISFSMTSQAHHSESNLVVCYFYIVHNLSKFRRAYKKI